MEIRKFSLKSGRVFCNSFERDISMDARHDSAVFGSNKVSGSFKGACCLLGQSCRQFAR